MKIGIVKEIKVEEYRVGVTPPSAEEYIDAGHTVTIETNACVGSGFPDAAYEAAGCTIEKDKKKIFDESDMIIHVKEPLAEEYDLFHKGQILYTYLHMAANKPLADAMLEKKVNSIAYELLMEEDGSLPLLIPMSQIAGRLAVQEGAKYLEKTFGGEGALLGGVPGIPKGKVVIIGGGIVGINACKIAVGMGANVTILDVSASRLAYLDDIFERAVTTLYSNRGNIKEAIKQADLVVGAVLLPGGASAPKLVEKEDLKLMKKGAVIVDVAVDQGGCIETTRATTHQEPTYIVDGIVHYCVANMPGCVALSSTLALTSVTNRYGLQVANLGLEKALDHSKVILSGLNTYMGKLTNEAVANDLDLPYSPY